MKSAALVIALFGLMVLVVGGVSQIQARSGTVMDFCPPQGTLNCAIVTKFWLKQASPDDRQIGGVADAIVAATRDRKITAPACADTAEALRALARAAQDDALRTRIGGLAELLCARKNGIASVIRTPPPDLGQDSEPRDKDRGGASTSSSGTSGQPPVCPEVGASSGGSGEQIAPDCDDEEDGSSGDGGTPGASSGSPGESSGEGGDGGTPGDSSGSPGDSSGTGTSGGTGPGSGGGDGT